jgi:tetratricopeptide (TPR) repeat protein
MNAITPPNSLVSASNNPPLEQANRFLQIGDWEAALLAFDQAIASEPENWDIWNERSVLLERMDRLAESLAGLDHVLKFQPHSAANVAQIWYNRGNILLGQKDFEAAIASYNQALECNPDLLEALNNLAICLERMGDITGAIATIEQAILLQPQQAEFLKNRGIWQSQLENWQGALQSFDQALAIRPGYGEVWYRRGQVLDQRQEVQAAIASYRQATAVQPNHVDAWNDLGVQLEKNGEYEKAKKSYEQAIACNSEFYISWYNLGNVLQKLDQHAAAIPCYQKAIELKPDYVDAHCNLGFSFDRQNLFDQAIACYQEALFLRPDFLEAKRSLKLIFQKIVPRWHFSMLNDTGRNDIYDQALRKIISPDSIVLDIGSGSGLLAMMAARAGAKQVISCEMVAPIAVIAREIVEQNGFSDRISIIAKKSTNLEVGTDLTEKANVLVTETFDVGLLGEEALSSIRHAIANLLTPDAIILPARATVFMQLIESSQLVEEDLVTSASGFDVSRFNWFSTTPNYLQKPVNQFSHVALSSVQEVFRFDFYHAYSQSEEKIMEFSILADGKIQAFSFWFELWLDDELTINTSPYLPYTCWHQAVQLLPEPLAVQRGDLIKLKAMHNCLVISFEIE